eukprot:6469902-Pyramimonas_sp.AAC.1
MGANCRINDGVFCGRTRCGRTLLAKRSRAGNASSNGQISLSITFVKYVCGKWTDCREHRWQEKKYDTYDS